MSFYDLSPMAYGSTAVAGTFLAFSVIVSKAAALRASEAAVMFVYMIPPAIVGLIWLLLTWDFRITGDYWFPFAVSFVANVAANLLYLKGLKITQASLAGATVGLAPVFAALVAWVFLHEVLSFKQWIGIILSFVGLVIMYIPERSEKVSHKDIYAFFLHAGNRLMVLAAFCWAVASPFDKAAAVASSPQMHCFLIYLSMLPPSLFIVWRQGCLSELRFSYRDMLIVSGAGGLRGIGYGFQLVALLLTPVGVFETLKRITQQIVVLTGGRVFFGEKITGWKIAGSLVFLLSIPLVISS